MAKVLPPPAERFDPITARWLVPGGPLHDPQRDSVDPDHGQQVNLVGPVPPELAEPDAQPSQDRGRRARRRWMVLAMVVLTVLAIALGMWW